jgi:putative transcriptional regulator
MFLQNRLKEIRLQKGYTQETLAQAVGVSRQSIIAVEKGKYKPTIELALKLALTLGYSVEKIFWLQDTHGEK